MELVEPPGAEAEPLAGGSGPSPSVAMMTIDVVESIVMLPCTLTALSVVELAETTKVAEPLRSKFSVTTTIRVKETMPTKSP